MRGSEHFASATSPVKKQPRKGPATTVALLSNYLSIVYSFCDQPHPSSVCGSVTDINKRKQLLVKAGSVLVEGVH